MGQNKMDINKEAEQLLFDILDTVHGHGYPLTVEGNEKRDEKIKTILQSFERIAEDAFIKGRTIEIKDRKVVKSLIDGGIVSEHPTFANYWKSLTDNK